MTITEERIKKLAEQAGVTHKTSLGVYQFYEEELYEFAKLISNEPLMFLDYNYDTMIDPNTNNLYNSLNVTDIIAYHPEALYDMSMSSVTITDVPIVLSSGETSDIITLSEDINESK